MTRETYITEAGQIEYILTDKERAERIASVKAGLTSHLINWDDWLNREHISLDDALLLSIGQNPTGFDSHDSLCGEGSSYDEYKNQAVEWIKKSELKADEFFIDTKRYFKVKPMEFFRLAINAYWDDLQEPVYIFVRQAGITSNQSYYIEDWANKDLDKHLTHFEIAELWATPERKQGDVKQYETLISQAVEDGDLLAEVSISNPKAIGGYEVIPYSPTTLRQADNGFLNGGYLQFTVHRDKFREWLIKSNQWPLTDGCLLAKWWPDAEQQAEALGDGGAADEEASAKNIKANSNGFLYSGLLHIPSGVDDWFEVIDVMTKAFYSKNNDVMPTKAQAWAELCINTPIGYGIESKRNQSLKMPGVAKEFNKRSFDRRWVKYTAKLNPFKPN